MEQSQFSLSWEAHKRNICNGLSSLQQNSEFVDMTLAADGHMVKVHQVIIALASPYIKELIASAQCPHPVIFLNKISYATLSALLEYIYTGEVLVSMENLNELIVAGKELHIKGLEDMRLQQSTATQSGLLYKVEDDGLDDENIYFEITNPRQNEKEVQSPYIQPDEINKPQRDTVQDLASFDEEMQEESMVHQQELGEDEQQEVITPDLAERPNNVTPSVMQYTVSNQGSLQMILNRFTYFLKHTNKDTSRQWRCVDYLNTLRCPAFVITKSDMVTHRVQSHNHPFHDKRILKKVQAGAVFSAIQEAVFQGNTKKPVKRVGTSASNNSNSTGQNEAEE